MNQPVRIITCLAAALLGAVVSCVHAATPVSTSSYSVATPVTHAGQSATLLPNGDWLLLGGEIAGKVSGVAELYNPSTQHTTALTSTLNLSRAWQTATLLPNGQVFIFGGIGTDGNLVSQAETFDPNTNSFALVISTGLVPRAHGTATLLTSGLVLFAGGDLSGGTQLWDPDTKIVTTLNSAMLFPRFDGKAVLLSTGPALISGGMNGAGQPVPQAELFLPSSNAFQAVNADSSLLPPLSDFSALPSVAAAIPEDGASGVAVTARLALRFNQPLDVSSLNSSTVTLIGPAGEVASKVVPADSGLLLFVTPNEELLPAAYYTLFIKGATNPSGQTLPLVSLGFSTAALNAGSSPAPVSGAAAGSISITYSNGPVSPGVWQPSSLDYGRDWTLGPATFSAAARVPMLQAAPGVTALAGQVLLQNGVPLPGVAISIGNQNSVTDAHGRFLIGNITAGHIEFIVNGRTANSATIQYGQFVIGADLQPNVTTTLGYTIWMPVIDSAHAVNIPSPTTQEVDVTSPLMPGVVLKIPAGVVIREPNGQIVTSVSLTPVPVNRAPFPIPAGFPMYFVIQPGGAYLISENGDQNVGARIIYPNTRGLAKNSAVVYHYYNPATSNWDMYGHGHVSSDGGRIVAGREVKVPEFTAFGYAFNPVTPPSVAPPPGDCTSGRDGDPVDCYTGLFLYNHVDMVLPDTVPIVIDRTYQSSDTYARNFGIGFSHPYNLFLYTSAGGGATNFTTLSLVQADGSQIVYTRTASSSITGLSGLQMIATATPTQFCGSTITYDGTYLVLTLKDGTQDKFLTSMGRPLHEIINRNGQTLQVLFYSDTLNGNVYLGPIETLLSPNGRSVTFQYASTDSYPGNSEITSMTDNSGRTLSYAYDSSNRLIKVTYPDGGVEQYTYNGTTDEIQSIILPNGQTQVTNTYDSNGRVTKQVLADGGVYQFAYVTNSSNQVTQTTVTDPNGNVRVLNFNSAGYVTSETQASGTALAETTTYTRDPTSNFVNSMTDPLNRTTSFGYNSMGDLTGITYLAGTLNAVSYAFTFNANFNELTGITDPLGHNTTYGYDSLGDLTSIKNGLNVTVATINYDTTTGLPTQITDALGHAVNLGYTGGDLTSVTDALGRTTTRYVDSIGRVASVTDPVGNRSLYSYDPMNRATSITDALGAVTTLVYDQDGNLKTVTDARGGLTQFGYDTSDRETSRTDALGQIESFGYDLDNNLSGHTDRKGQSQVLVYDALNRLTQVTYKIASGSTESTVYYNYDAGNRVTSIADSVGGTLTENYDGLDRLNSEISPQGSVSYQYDAASRRTQMTVAGQTAVNYGYDNADRLLSITQGSSSVSIGYDNANRRSTLTLPNGIKLSYGYDNANELTGLTYTLGTGTVGTMTYGYDSDGRIINRGGTFDVTNLPASLTSATYDANNRLTKWGRQAVSYDADGNLVSNGKNTYTWNTRNQLTGISGSTTASFLYDALGRRESKTISSTSTNFLYDGLNLEQELNGTTPTVNYLTSTNLDETLSRTDSGGTQNYLTDNLGSTLALTSSAGAISTSYSYDSYGNTTATGTTSTNALQYTGRENDGTGLYYYRARYYSPAYGRFINEDPIGLLGGINEYGYASGNPMNLDDPLGLADWRQFQMGGLDQQGAQALGAEQSVAAEVAANQYFAKQISFLGSQCFAIEFAAEFKANATPAQRDLGAWELYQDGSKLLRETRNAAIGADAELGLDQAAIYAAGRGSTVSVARLLLLQTGVKIAGIAPLVGGAALDIGDMLNSAFDVMYYNSNSCCSKN